MHVDEVPTEDYCAGILCETIISASSQLPTAMPKERLPPPPAPPIFSDPFAAALLPPPDESPDERSRRIQREHDAKRISDSIDEQLQLERFERKKSRSDVNVLLLGQSESGKSTTLKRERLSLSTSAFVLLPCRGAAVCGSSSPPTPFRARREFSFSRPLKARLNTSPQKHVLWISLWNPSFSHHLIPADNFIIDPSIPRISASVFPRYVSFGKNSLESCHLPESG